MPESFTKGSRSRSFRGKELKMLRAAARIQEFGESGQEIWRDLPALRAIATTSAYIRSLRTEAINHDPAHNVHNTGTTISGRPSMGSWLTYGLGADTENLPGFVVLTSTGKFGQSQPIASRQWSAGFLPSRFQGVELRSKGDPVLVRQSAAAGVSLAQQRDVVEQSVGSTARERSSE